ncbi:hypothetical protein AVEN_16961-1 [Araneus ventricosus]|uniref:Uncharacterized protein n=1 Tax=Araneus ventricosus TaxID=182803 RepID=A0A4Y2D6Q9_ARAVE|nr:hypothetical protein AVEN_16961-1 [Araneus ventricosus]
MLEILGGSFIKSFRSYLPTNKLDTKRSFVFHRTWASPIVSANIQPCRNLILLLWGNWHINPLCHGLPPQNLLPYGTTQPTISASLVPKRGQLFSVEKEDPQFDPPSPKRNPSFPSRPRLLFFFLPSLVFSQMSAMLSTQSQNLGQQFHK